MFTLVAFLTIRWSTDDFTGNSSQEAIEKLLVNTLAALQHVTGNDLHSHLQRERCVIGFIVTLQIIVEHRFKSVIWFCLHRPKQAGSR